MFKIKLTLLEYKQGIYEGTPYANCIARYEGKILKFKLDKSIPDLSQHIDEELECTFSIVAGQNLAASIKIDGVEI